MADKLDKDKRLPMKDIFVINETNGRKFWNRCGRAFVNQDGSMNFQLDLFPSVHFQIRDRKPSEEG